MEKLKLTEKQKYCLLQDAHRDIVSLGIPFRFPSVYECDSVKFKVGAFSKKNGARIEVVYSFKGCSICLLWHYVKKCISGGIAEDFIFIPKAITIGRPFECSVLFSILPDLNGGTRYYYQSTKSIFELCVGEEEGAVPAIASVEAEDDGNTLKPMMQ